MDVLLDSPLNSVCLVLMHCCKVDNKCAMAVITTTMSQWFVSLPGVPSEAGSGEEETKPQFRKLVSTSTCFTPNTETARANAGVLLGDACIGSGVAFEAIKLLG